MWWNLFVLVVILATLFLIKIRFKDRRYLKGSTRDALGPDMKKEIEEEKKLFLKHQARFQGALEKVSERRLKTKNKGH